MAKSRVKDDIEDDYRYPKKYITRDLSNSKLVMDKLLDFDLCWVRDYLTWAQADEHSAAYHDAKLAQDCLKQAMAGLREAVRHCEGAKRALNISKKSRKK